MFTYDVISESVRNPHELAAELTRRSEQGWEVVHIVYDGAAWFHAFIRHEGRVSVAPFAGSTDTSTSVVATAPMATPSSADAVTRVGTAVPAATVAAQPVAAQTVATQPSATTPSPTVAGSSVPDVPANWYKDPSGRYELRYWNGSAWTEHVATGGRQSVDPPRS